MDNRSSDRSFHFKTTVDSGEPVSRVTVTVRDSDALGQGLTPMDQEGFSVGYSVFGVDDREDSFAGLNPVIRAIASKVIRLAKSMMKAKS